MLNVIDNFLNRITMYRLVLYVLIGLLGIAVIFSATGLIGYDPFALLFSIGFLLAACALSNWALAKIMKIPANAESTYISALILALIISPIRSYNDLWFLGWASVLAMASKYILAINKRHIFNPVAIAVAITYFTINQSASWWVGDGPMLPFVLIGGLLLVRKIARFELVVSFFASALISIVAFSLINGDDVLTSLQRTLVYSPIMFFAFIILTEPLTTPPNQKLRAIYGALTGLLFAPQIHIGSFYITPEIAILIGNVFSFIVSPKSTLILTLKEKIRVAPDIYDFIFMPDRKLAFSPGQYMEWTLGHDDPDTRGNRRYFTLASSPTEDQLRLGVKFYPNGSSFKQALLKMDHQQEIVATQLAGDFVLPNNPNQKCVFIAGGVGVTPFRSMIKYLMDTRQKRSIVLFYVNRSINDIIYKDVFDKAQKQLGLKTIYTVTDPSGLPANWPGKVGRITPDLIKAEVPDYQHCVFYISGPRSMVDSFTESLRQLHVPSTHIKTDFFAGLA
jgi:ferredoxin-NADP reductase